MNKTTSNSREYQRLLYLAFPERLAATKLVAHQWKVANRKKVRAYKARWRQRNPDYHVGAHFKNRYGITIADYAQMLEKQNGVCAICGAPPSGNQRLHVDHNHTTKIVRALLCRKCNLGIGYFGDSVVLLASAIQYLSR